MAGTHRIRLCHGYEFNREYEDQLKAAGLKITSETPDNTYGAAVSADSESVRIRRLPLKQSLNEGHPRC